MAARPLRLLLDVLVGGLLAVALIGVSAYERHTRPAAAGRPVTPPPPPAVVARPPVVRMAVIPGSFDLLGPLLERLGEGYRFEVVGEEALRDPAVKSRFDAVFLTCGERAEGKTIPPLGPALRDFVAGGGILYASDLRFDDLKAAFPEFVDPESVTQGVKSAALTARVVDPGLRAVLGPELALHFDLDGWRPAAFRGPGVTVYLAGTVPTTAGIKIEAPLMVKFAFGKGAVLFTSFHNTQQQSGAEEKLLRYLVLSTVTAGVESGVVESLEQAGFTRVDSTIIAAAQDQPSLTRVFRHASPGKLTFSLGFEPRGARILLTLKGPGGEVFTKRGDSSFSIEIPDAAAGSWTYTTTAEAMPYENFPVTLGVGEVRPPAPKATAVAPAPQPQPRPDGQVTFQEVRTVTGAAAARPVRIAVTPPMYDDMGKLLRSLGDGYRFDEVDLDDVRRPGTLDRYDILFLTCDAWPGSWASGPSQGTEREGVVRGAVDQGKIRETGESLRRFVGRGGTLYASDLRYDCVVAGFPERRRAVMSEGVLDELQDAERRWVADLAPTARVGTVEETVRGLTLSAGLAARLRQLVAVIEASGLADAEALNTPARAQRELSQWLQKLGLPATDADLVTLVGALADRARAVQAAIAVRTPRAREKSRLRVAATEERVKALRARITLNETGSGARQQVTARVVDPGLRGELGETVALDFNMPDWSPANFHGPGQTVLIRGEFTSTRGEREDAPLLVRFPEGEGNVIFTSFHNEKVNSAQEQKLLRYLVFTAVTARAEEVAMTTMLSGGFSPADRSLQSHSSGQPSVTRTYRSIGSGPLRFALAFAGQGAVMRFTLVSPGGQTFDRETPGPIVVEARGATAGDWRYTVTAVRVPHENFPYSVNVGRGSGG